MRIEMSEKDRLEAARAFARPKFDGYIRTLEVDASQYWDDMEVAYWPYYTFEETLAAFAEDATQSSRISMLYSMVRVAARVSGIAEMKPPSVERDRRLEVLNRYALGHARLMIEEFSDEAEIYTEVRLRYREWSRTNEPMRLLSGDVLARLDGEGPLPKSLQSDDDFMMFLLKSRDRVASHRRLTEILSVVIGAMGLALLIVGAFQSQSNLGIVLPIVGGVVAGLSAVALFWGRLRRSSVV